MADELKTSKPLNEALSYLKYFSVSGPKEKEARKKRWELDDTAIQADSDKIDQGIADAIIADADDFASKNGLKYDKPHYEKTGEFRVRFGNNSALTFSSPSGGGSKTKAFATGSIWFAQDGAAQELLQFMAGLGKKVY